MEVLNIHLTFSRKLKAPNDGEQVRLIGFIENIFGEDKYNPRYSYTITDFEVKQTQEQKEAQAFDEYHSTMQDNDMVEIDDNFLE